MAIRTKRLYDPPERGDGRRVLVDRLWPRGMKKSDASFDEWLRDAAPSTELRRWFAHDAAKWDEFRRRYAKELEAPAARAAVERLKEFAARGDVTLLYSARDEEHNNAAALRDYLEHF